MPPRLLVAHEADRLLSASEGQKTLYEGLDQNPDGTAHTHARHYLITNDHLMKRLRVETRNGAFGFFSAFITRTDMVAAALEVLNGPAGLWARDQLFGQAASPKRAQGSHTGMRAVIEHYGAWTCRVRYAGGAPSVMPISGFRMLLDRVDERPLGLHVHTFFPTQNLREPVSRAEIKYRTGRLFARWP